MNPRTNRTFICSVLFLDIVEYSKQPVMEQIQQRNLFNHFLSEMIKDIAVNDRIIIDTGDGAAIGFLGDPEDALFVAMGIRDSILNEDQHTNPSLSIRMGINLGPVKLVKDINKQINLIGDGINVAQRIMSFAQPGQLLVSRSYFDVISCLSKEYAKLFDYQGLHPDKHIREHEIYAVGHYEGQPSIDWNVEAQKRNLVVETDDAASWGRRRPTESDIPNTDIADRGKKPPSSLETKYPYSKKWLLAAIPVLVAMVLFTVFTLRGGKGPSQTSLPPTVAVTAPKPQAAASPPLPSSSKEVAVSDSTAKTAISAPDLPSIRFRVLPWGEIYINGTKKGVTPPLTTVKLKPGRYNIQIRNSSFPPYSKVIELKTNDRVQIKHEFP